MCLPCQIHQISDNSRPNNCFIISAQNLSLCFFIAKTDGTCPPNFKVSVSNLEFSQTRYGWEFQRFPPKFSSSTKCSREPFNFPLNIEFFIWSLRRCASPRCCCLNPVHHIAQDLGCCQDKKHIHFNCFNSLQELKELGKYEYFFRVYHNNETDKGTVDLGLGWIKVKRPIILGSSPAKVPYRSSPLGQHLEYFLCFCNIFLGCWFV